MKLHPPSLSSHGPSTPAKLARREPHTDHDAVDKYHRDRLAFIAAAHASPSCLAGVGGKLLVGLTRDPEPDVALAACRAVNRVLEGQGLVFDISSTLKTINEVLISLFTASSGSSTHDQCGFSTDDVVSIQMEACLVIDTFWRSMDDFDDDFNTEELADECARACAPYLVGPSTDDDVRAAATRAVVASCLRRTGDCNRAIETILEASKMSSTHDELQKHAFRLFSEKASCVTPETVDVMLRHAVAWLDCRAELYRQTDSKEKKEYDEARQMREGGDAVLTAVVSFIETTVALGSTSNVLDEELCSLLCAYAEVGIGDLLEDASGEPPQSTTVILQVLARLVNDRETFSLVVSKRISLLKAICTACLDDIEGPMFLPALFCIGHVSKASPEACRVVSIDLREKQEDPVDVTSALVIAVAHGKQGNARQVAAWVLGVIGSSSSAAAQHVATSGGLLTLMDAIRASLEFETLDDDIIESSSKVLTASPTSSSVVSRTPQSTLAITCHDACTAIISRLDNLPILVALLKLKDTPAVDTAPYISPPPSSPGRIQEILFERIAQLLEHDVAFRADFVQHGALEALITLGETRSELHAHMAHVCSLYPQELVDRCSPKYMKKLIDAFKRSSCLLEVSDDVEKGERNGAREEVYEPATSHTPPDTGEEDNDNSTI